MRSGSRRMRRRPLTGATKLLSPSPLPYCRRFGGCSQRTRPPECQTGCCPLLLPRLAMRIPGQRIKRKRLVQTEKYVVAVEVEVVVPVDDLSEPGYEAETVQLLREIQVYAERGDVAWLTQKGKVYA